MILAIASSDDHRCFRGVLEINSVRVGYLIRWKEVEADLCTKQGIQHLLHFDFECFAIAAVRSPFTGLEVRDVDRCGLQMGYRLRGKGCSAFRGPLVNRSLERLAACV